MGTGATIVIIFRGKQYRLQVYYDGYPSYLGRCIRSDLLWLLLDKPHMIEMLENMVWIEDGHPEPTDEEIKKLKKWSNLKVSTQSPKEWYCLLRKTQGRLRFILEAGYAEASSEDTGMMEDYSYVVDFDKEIFSCNECGWKIPFSALSDPSHPEMKKFFESALDKKTASDEKKLEKAEAKWEKNLETTAAEVKR